MSNTNEPWKTDIAGGFPQDVENSDGNLIARCPSDCADDIDGVINARRIVACVNACAGISTESMEDGGVGSILSLGLEEQRRGDIAEKQRDELLAVLINSRNALESANEIGDGPIVDTIWIGKSETLFDYMDAAIAKGGAR